LNRAFKHAKDPKVKARIMAEADDLETEYLDVHEED
jgi:hypothetical protein